MFPARVTVELTLAVIFVKKPSSTVSSTTIISTISTTSITSTTSTTSTITTATSGSSISTTISSNSSGESKDGQGVSSNFISPELMLVFSYKGDITGVSWLFYYLFYCYY